MDILDFFWTFYLNHLSPLWGYFFYLFYCFHQVIITDIGYNGFVAIYFAQMEHWTRIGKALKLHLKLISLAKFGPSAMNEISQ